METMMRGKVCPANLRNEKWCECIHWVWNPEMGNYDEDGHHPGCNNGKGVWPPKRTQLLSAQEREDIEQIEYIGKWVEKNPSGWDKTEKILLSVVGLGLIVIAAITVYFWRS